MRDIRHATCLMLGLALIATSSIASDEQMSAESRDEASVSSDLKSFDVPAQPLISALETYGAISGWQVVYDAALVTGRQSTAVKGTFTPEIALRKLLAGTDLSPRYMAADGFVLVPEAAPRGDGVNTAPRDAVLSYYGRIQAGFRQTFCTDRGVRLGGYRAAVSLWISPSGVVSRAALLDSTGDTDLDAVLNRGVSRMNIGESPPAGFAQPVIMVITPDVVRDCLTGQQGAQRPGAGP